MQITPTSSDLYLEMDAFLSRMVGDSNIIINNLALIARGSKTLMP